MLNKSNKPARRFRGTQATAATERQQKKKKMSLKRATKTET